MGKLAKLSRVLVVDELWACHNKIWLETMPQVGQATRTHIAGLQRGGRRISSRLSDSLIGALSRGLYD